MKLIIAVLATTLAGCAGMNASPVASGCIAGALLYQAYCGATPVVTAVPAPIIATPSGPVVLPAR